MLCWALLAHQDLSLHPGKTFKKPVTIELPYVKAPGAALRVVKTADEDSDSWWGGEVCQLMTLALKESCTQFQKFIVVQSMTPLST